MEPRPLGKAATLAEAVGLKITHAWEDLAFGEHSAFIMQLSAEGKPVQLYFNRDLEQPKRRELEESFVAKSADVGLPLELAGSFTLAQKEGTEELEIAFFVPQTTTN